MSWCRAVWIERGIEEEGVIPTCWTEDSIVRWPSKLNVIRAHKEQTPPDETWFKFKLVKVKCTDDDEKVCDDYNFTAASNDEDQEIDQAESNKKEKIKTKKPKYSKDDLRKYSTLPGGSPKATQSKTSPPLTTNQQPNAINFNISETSATNTTESNIDSTNKENSSPTYSNTKKFKIKKSSWSKDKKEKKRKVTSPSEQSCISQRTDMRLSHSATILPSNLPGISSLSSLDTTPPVEETSFDGKQTKHKKKTPSLNRKRSLEKNNASTSSTPKEKQPAKFPIDERSHSAAILPSNLPGISSLPSLDTTPPVEETSFDGNQTKHKKKTPSLKRKRSLENSNVSTSTRKEKQPAKFPIKKGRFQYKVLHLLTDIRDEIRTVSAYCKAESTNFISTQFNEVEEFTAFDHTLFDNTELVKNLKLRLSNTGGTSCHANVKAMLCKIMTYKLFTVLQEELIKKVSVIRI